MRLFPLAALSGKRPQAHADTDGAEYKDKDGQKEGRFVHFIVSTMIIREIAITREAKADAIITGLFWNRATAKQPLTD